MRSAKPRSKAKRIFLKILKWTGIMILLAVLGLYGFVRYDFYSAAVKLPQLETRAKELGLPLTPEDMKPNPPVKPEDNAAPLLRQAGESLDENKALKGDVSRFALEAPYAES